MIFSFEHVADFNLVAGLLNELVDDAAFNGVALTGQDDRDCIALPCAYRSSCCGCGGGSGFSNGSRQIGVAVLGGTELLEIVAGVADYADVEQAGNIVTFLEEVGQQGTCNGSGLFEGCLVGFIGEEHVAHCDCIAGLLLKLVDDTAFNSIALSRHNDWNCHVRCILPFS